MNKILVISAYPKGEKGLGEMLLASTKVPNIEVLNLYRSNLSFYKGEKEPSLEANELFDKLKEYDNWVFLFPVWWSNVPAILKNFFDWAILYGLVYDGESVPKEALKGKNKKAIIVCTSGDIYDDEQKSVTKLVGEDILQYWGVNVVGSLFIENTYNFNENQYKNYQEDLNNLLSTSFL